MPNIIYSGEEDSGRDDRGTIFQPYTKTASASASTGGTLPQGTDLLALITAIQGITTTTPENPLSSTADENKEKLKGMSRGDLNTTLRMCGKASTGDIMDIPSRMQECATKVTRKHYK